MTDPRIHRRRVEVARAHGRRRRHLIVVAVVVVALVAGGLAALHSSLFGATHVEVTGSAHTSRTAVVRAAGLEGAPPLVDLSTAVIATRVERLPWVLRATVALSWPDTVRIHLTERTPVAVVADAGGFAVVDPTGRVLEQEGPRPPGLPLLATAGDPPRPGARLSGRGPALAAVAAAMPESMVSETAEIAVASPGIVVVLTDHVTAVLGSATALHDKFVALATVLAHGHLGETRTIDLTVPSAPVLIRAATSPIVARKVGG